MKEGYKKTELGWIPDEWEVGKFEDILVPRKETFNPKIEENEMYVGLEHIEEVTGRLICTGNSSDTSSIKNKFYNGDILFGKLRPYLRKYYMTDFNGVCVTEILVLTKKKSNNKFCYYSLQQDNFIEYINSKTFGTKMPRTSWNDIKEYPVCIPPLKEQQKIAEILSTIDTQIDDTDKLIEKTKELKKGLMQRLLTKGIGHTEFKITEVGDIPMEWEVKSLLEVANFNNGKAHEKNICEIGDFIVVNSKFISTEGEIKKYSNENISPLNKGDITLVMSDVPNGRAIGKCYLIDKDNKYTLNQRICCLRTEEMDKEFLFYYLNRNSYFLKFDDGAKQTNLRKEEVLGCPIRIPKIEEQKQIANILSSVDAQIEDYENKKSKLEELKKGLMQQLLTGKIRVV